MLFITALVASLETISFAIIVNHVHHIMADQQFIYVGGPQKTRGANMPLISSALWAKHKSQVEDWYIKQNCELSDVIARLRTEDGFSLLS